MKGFIVMAMFVASFANAAWKDHTGTRDVAPDAANVERVEIDASTLQPRYQWQPGHQRYQRTLEPETDYAIGSSSGCKI
jgi:hypothetical protein